MKEKYLKIKDLSVSEKLINFINKELLPGTKVNKEKFWSGFNKYVHELSFTNKKLLEKRERLQEIIDLQMKHAFIKNKEQVGKTHKVLIEGVSKKSNEELYGRNSQNTVLVFRFYFFIHIYL